MGNQVSLIKRILSLECQRHPSAQATKSRWMMAGLSLTGQKRPGCGEIPSLHQGLVEPQPCLTTGSA
jgi:hypothetical protein